MTTTQMYWIVMLDNISTAVGWTGFFLLVFSLFASIVSAMVLAEERKADQWPRLVGRWTVPAGILGAFLCLGCWFIPGTKQMAAIVVVPKLVNAIEGNKKLMGLPDKIVGLADEWLDTLKPKDEKPEK